MTSQTEVSLFSRYLYSNPKNLKSIKDVTIGDMLQVHEDEVQTAHDLEVERQIDYALIEKENS